MTSDGETGIYIITEYRLPFELSFCIEIGRGFFDFLVLSDVVSDAHTLEGSAALCLVRGVRLRCALAAVRSASRAMLVPALAILVAAAAEATPEPTGLECN